MYYLHVKAINIMSIYKNLLKFQKGHTTLVQFLRFSFFQQKTTLKFTKHLRFFVLTTTH